MENKKNKKKLFAIIGASALAFILTVALSVSITLAYFGDTKTSPATKITMGEKLTFTAAGVTASNKIEGSVLPGASGTVEVTGVIAKSTTKAFLRVKVEKTGDGATAIDLKNFTCADGTFVENDGYFYLTSSGEGTTATMKELDASSADKTLTLTGSYTVDKTLVGDGETGVAGKSITVTVTMQIIQSEYVGTTVASVAEAWGTVVG